MITTEDAIRVGRSLLGTPYGSEWGQLDCINLIKAIIRTAPGGVPGYTTAGADSLWKSYDSAAKYRDLMWRQTGVQGARAGMLAFKYYGGRIQHVGLVTGPSTVLHSSSALGCVVETDLNNGQWTHLAIHRYISANGEAENVKEDEQMTALYRAIVNTAQDDLNVREAPKTGKIIGRAPRGKAVDVLAEGTDGWPCIRYGELVGYASSAYLVRVDETVAQPEEGGGADTEEGSVRISLADAQAIYEALGEAYRMVSAALGND